MVSGTRAARAIETTAESLQADLARLEMQKQALERELAAVVAHLCSVQRALSALEPLMVSPDAAIPDQGRAAALAEPRTGTSSAELSELTAKSAKSARPGGSAGAAGAAKSRGPKGRDRLEPAAPAGPEADGPTAYGRLTEQIMEYFAGVGEADVRARDVAAALGRDADSGSINAVRSTLDRLVAASRVRRTGRGLYRAGR